MIQRLWKGLLLFLAVVVDAQNRYFLSIEQDLRRLSLAAKEASTHIDKDADEVGVPLHAQSVAESSAERVPKLPQTSQVLPVKPKMISLVQIQQNARKCPFEEEFKQVTMGKIEIEDEDDRTCKKIENVMTLFKGENGKWDTNEEKAFYTAVANFVGDDGKLSYAEAADLDKLAVVAAGAEGAPNTLSKAELKSMMWLLEKEGADFNREAFMNKVEHSLPKEAAGKSPSWWEESGSTCPFDADFKRITKSEVQIEDKKDGTCKKIENVMTLFKGPKGRLAQNEEKAFHSAMKLIAGDNKKISITMAEGLEQLTLAAAGGDDNAGDLSESELKAMMWFLESENKDGSGILKPEEVKAIMKKVEEAKGKLPAEVLGKAPEWWSELDGSTPRKRPQGVSKLFQNTLEVEGKLEKDSRKIDDIWSKEVQPARTEAAEKNVVYGYRVKDTHEKYSNLQDTVKGVLSKVGDFNLAFIKRLQDAQTELQSPVFKEIHDEVSNT